MSDSPTAWIENEDRHNRPDRIARLQWLAANYPAARRGFLLQGQSFHLLEEAKYCFAYGQFLATAVLGIAFVEHTLAARFYANGRDDLERATVQTLLHEARQSGWVTEAEYLELDSVRQLRNPLLHFRRPFHPTTIDQRALQENSEPQKIIEENARRILTASFRILTKAAI